MKITLKELDALDYDKDVTLKASKEWVGDNLYKVVAHLGTQKVVFRNIYALGDSIYHDYSALTEAEDKVARLLSDLRISYSNFIDYNDGNEMCPVITLDFEGHQVKGYFKPLDFKKESEDEMDNEDKLTIDMLKKTATLIPDESNDKPTELTKIEIKMINIHSLAVSGKKLLKEDWPNSADQPPYKLTKEEIAYMNKYYKGFYGDDLINKERNE